MGILYIRPLHFPNKEKSFCTKPIFLFKSNTMLQTKYSWCWRSVLYTGYFGRCTVVAVMLQTKEPVLGTGKTDHSKNSNSSTQHSSTGKTRTLADTEQLDHRVFRLTPTVSIILRPTLKSKTGEGISVMHIYYKYPFSLLIGMISNEQKGYDQH